MATEYLVHAKPRHFEITLSSPSGSRKGGSMSRSQGHGQASVSRGQVKSRSEETQSHQQHTFVDDIPTGRVKPFTHQHGGDVGVVEQDK